MKAKLAAPRPGAIATFVAVLVYMLISTYGMIAFVHSYCRFRPLILVIALLGLVFASVSLRNSAAVGGPQKTLYRAAGVFALLASILPFWLFVAAVLRCG